MLDVDSSAVIQDVKLLEKLLLDWKIWSKAQVNTLDIKEVDEKEKQMVHPSLWLYLTI